MGCLAVGLSSFGEQLETLAETPTSLNGLQTMLAEFMPSENIWQDALKQKWTDWREQGILVAA